MILPSVESSDRTRIFNFLASVDEEFHPPLSCRVNLEGYSEKLATHAINFFLCDNGRDIGHVAFYCNNSECNSAFISSIAVIPEFHGSGAASHLLQMVLHRCRERGIGVLRLEVDAENAKAICFYRKHGFRASSNNVMTRRIV